LRRRDKGWEELSTDEAFGLISQELSRIRGEYGAKSLVVHTGLPFIGSHIPRLASRFCSAYGTPNYTSGGSLCFMARAIGHSLTSNYGGMPSLHHLEGTKCIVVWGANPPQSNIIDAAAISSAKEGGAKLIVIDPRATTLAKKADVYAQIRPGSDYALALGLLYVIITEGLYDKRFVADWTVGFDKLAEHVRDYPPHKVEELTWVPAASIEDIARTYAANKPACIAQGVSLDHCTNGVQTSRAIAILIAITGNLDVAGGNVYYLPLKQAGFRIKGRVAVEEAIGAEYPLYTKFARETTATPVPDALISGKPYPIKALIVQGSNPILTWPNTAKVRRGFENLELLVVVDQFMTETAKLAHIVLPAANFLEQGILKDYAFQGLPLLIMGERALAPPGDCIEDWNIWAELGKRMGYGEYFPWREESKIFADLLQPTGITLEELKQKPGGLYYSPMERQKYLKEGFNTPSGKVEIYSETMEEHGYHPLPTFEGQSPLVEEYPLLLITGTRVSAFTHSQYRNIAVLRKHFPNPLVEINAETAKSLDIGDGDEVIIESPKGSIGLRAKVTEDIHPRVVSIQHGWDEANANLLTDDSYDPISGYPAFKGVVCRVIKEGKHELSSR
jgi:anaerobic selenocysteine-containing dehydrogenase